jgi:hypothetical protein
MSSKEIINAQERGEIILYQPDNTIELEVLVERETVWLSQAQMTDLFDRERSVITKHINNIFKENELDEKSNVQFLHIANSDKPVKLYNLDVIISVGYRVKSLRGTAFRRWATKILRAYILNGYAIHQRFERIEQRVAETEQKIDFFVKTSLPPKEGIFFDGQFFDAYAFASNLIKTAKKSISLIDNYIDESVLLLLSKRNKGVNAVIYTSVVLPELRLDLKKHNAQYPPIVIETFTRAHDRFLFIDNAVYHIGASLKDLGMKWFAFSKIDIAAGELLKLIKRNI